MAHRTQKSWNTFGLRGARLYWGLLLMLGLVFSQSALAQSKKSPVLIEFDNGRTVTQDEFEYVYQKNNGGLDSARMHTVADYKEYLDLYIKFKRKVMEAESMGIDTTQSFKAELSEYVRQLAQPYLVEKDVLERMIREAYERSKEARKVSHLLLSLNENADPADTLAVYNQIMGYRDGILQSDNIETAFRNMAGQFSQEPNANETKGYLSWFTAFDFVYAFEEAAFTTPTGQVSMPIRTEFGYHLIYVHDKKALNAPRLPAHILVRYGPTYEAKDSAQAAARIQEVYQKLQNGGDFAELAKAYSDDPNTRDKGGELGERYIPIPEMQDRRYELRLGELSQPFETQYGFHIMKVEEGEPFKPFEESRPFYKQKVTRDGRAQVAEDKLIAKLKKQYSFSRNEANVKKFIEAVKDEYNNPKFTGENLPAEILNMPLFTFAGDREATSIDLLNHSNRGRRRRTRNVPPVEVQIRDDLESLERKHLLDYEETQLAKKYPEFARLQQEYREGIMLFSLTEQKVWRKAVEDTAGLKAFYEKNRQQFRAGERVRIKEYRSRDEKMILKVDSLFQAGASVETVDTTIENQGWFVRTARFTFDRDSRNAKRFYDKKAGYRFSPTKEGNSWTIQIIDEFLKPGVKEYEEAKSEAITLYQNHLEEQWIEELEQKYPCEVHEEVLGKLFR